jgi:flagellar protein FliL
MADAPKPDAPDPPPPPPGPSKLLIILGMVVPPILAGAASYAGSLMGAQQAIAAPPADSAAADVEAPGPTVRMAPFVLSMTDEEGQPHAMKVTLAVELKRDASDTDFASYVPRARDAVIRVLRGLTFEEATNKSTHQKLRERLLDELHVLGAEQAENVWFIDFVVQ